MKQLRIGLVGDRDDSITAHRAIPRALELAAQASGRAVQGIWLATDGLGEIRFDDFHGLWCVPGSPYRDTEGALGAITHARRTALPFLGTCGGFQHALLEYARNVLGWADAEHAETAPGAQRAVISPLPCALRETLERIQLLADSRLAAAYGTPEAFEGYHCGYGLNPTFREALTEGPLRVAATDAAGAVRAVELEGHPFFVATLFQPERAALIGRLPPLVAAFVNACQEHGQ
ncbi:CTP synthase [Pseudomonas sp. JM0905a]|uniref:CTP synthase (glutamine hydrolyzing) n=1 Tax=Metapseudomonas resinovorans TaxID=53412 RepID=A0ABT4Y5P8_METRE|nr:MULTISPECIES: CTP synthase [Pseudomonas]MBD2837767.1 CTP synthase [Pseudomonas sp. JM0905a]MDA8484044.1 CTP synthase [Pseudomonas resinovorans]